MIGLWQWESVSFHLMRLSYSCAYLSVTGLVIMRCGVIKDQRIVDLHHIPTLDIHSFRRFHSQRHPFEIARIEERLPSQFSLLPLR